MLKTSPASDAEVTASSPGGARAVFEVVVVLENESSALRKTVDESSLESVLSDPAAATTEASSVALESSCAESDSVPGTAASESLESFASGLEFESSADAETQPPDHATAAPDSVCASP